MHTKLTIALEFTDCCNVTVDVYNREQMLTQIYQADNTLANTTVNFVFPGQLNIKINNLTNQTGSCKLQSLTLGGLDISTEKLDTLCFTTENETSTGVWVREAYKDSTITVDFWAKDWIQYHLLIGNTIEL